MNPIASATLLVFAALALLATLAWLSVPHRYPGLDEVLDEIGAEEKMRERECAVGGPPCAACGERGCPRA